MLLYRLLFILILAFSLSGCASRVALGISESEWQNYSPDERHKMTASYFKMLKSKVYDSDQAGSENSAVAVCISGGQVKMPPAFNELYAYKPVEFVIANGDCVPVMVNQLKGDRSIKMQACYRNKTLYLDPSRYDFTKKFGSIQLHYSPIWKRGFTYQKVSSDGYVRLTNVDVAVKVVNHNESDTSE
jgi:hypothetical protein